MRSSSLARVCRGRHRRGSTRTWLCWLSLSMVLAVGSLTVGVGVVVAWGARLCHGFQQMTFGDVEILAQLVNGNVSVSGIQQVDEPTVATNVGPMEGAAIRKEQEGQPKFGE